MKTTKTSPHFVRKKLHREPLAFVESVGRDDMQGLADAFDGTGRSVVRVILGATTKMPLRAATYVESAARCAQVINADQLHVVHAVELGAKANGTNKLRALQQAQELSRFSIRYLNAVLPEVAARTIFATDTQVDLAPFTKICRKVMQDRPELAAVHAERARRHSGDTESHLAYLGAHLLFQDTNLLPLEPLLPSNEVVIVPDTIVSVGHRGERESFEMRMAMRQRAGDVELLNTAQIFTKHAHPPYFMSRDPEPTILDAVQGRVDFKELAQRAGSHELKHFAGSLAVGILGVER